MGGKRGHRPLVVQAPPLPTSGCHRARRLTWGHSLVTFDPCTIDIWAHQRQDDIVFLEQMETKVQ